jgi:hypothetical protein
MSTLSYMAEIRAQFVGQMFTGFAEDRVVNTFHFVNGQSVVDHMSSIATQLNEFYTEPPAGSDNAIGAYISPVVNRAFNIVQYDLAEAEPRVPNVSPGVLPTALGSGLPEEVAICLSYHGAAPVTARRRGRIYLGPLVSAGAYSYGNNTAFGALDPNFLATITGAASRLKDTPIGLGTIGWAIRSTVPSENFVAITAGWVDNRADTVRRRGPDASVRTVWT